MENSLLFSIVIPTFNRANFLSIAINSIQKQSYSNWEVLIIDDGSTDNTKEIVSIKSKKDNRIKYFFQKNQERSAARNNGIKIASGDFICFLDSDDYYLENHLEKINFYILKNIKKSFFFTDFQFSSNQKINSTHTNQYLKNSSIISYSLLNPIATGRAIIRKDLLVKNNFNTSIRIGEDIELWSRIATDQNAFHIPINSYIQVEHNKRSIRVGQSITQIEHINTLNIIKKTISKKIDFYSYKEALSYAYLKVGESLIIENNKMKALRYLIEGIFIKPNHLTKRFLFQIYQCLKTSTTLSK